MGDIQRCPYCKTSEDCPYLQNVNIKSAGFIIYRYSTCVKDLNSYTGRKESSTEIFILHNTKNVDIASEKLIPKLVQYKKCPRCKYILENAEKLLRNIPVINKLDVLGICDKCRAKGRKDISSCECSEVIKKFISIKESEKIEFRKGKRRESQLQKLFNRSVNKDEESKCNARNKSESAENKCHVFKQKPEPQVGHLIEAKKKLRVTSKLQQGKIPFSKTVQKIRFTREHCSGTELGELNAEITNSGSSIKLQKSLHSYDKNNLTEYDATYFQSLRKKSKEYPLRRISISEESLYLNFHDLIDKAAKSNSKRPPTHVQTTPRFNKDSEPSILDLIAEKNKHRKEYDTKETQDFDTKRISVVSEVGTDILKTKLDRISSPDTISKYKSDEAFSASLLAKTKELLQKDFSYFFIKEAELKNKLIQSHKSSSELIKDTQDMLLAREKDIKKIYSEKFKYTLDENEQKRKALEEKIRLLKENKTDLKKDKENKKLEEIKKQIREEREINVSEKLHVKSKETKSIEKESKNIRETSEKSKKSDVKAEPKLKHVKQEKETDLRLEKEQKMKEKEKLKMEEKGPSRKEKQGKDKQKSIGEKAKKEPSEKENQHSRTEKAISAKVKENQPARDNEMREQKKDGIPKNDIQKRNKEKEEKSEKEERHDDNLKKVIENQQKEPSEIEAEKTKIHSADMKKAKEEAALKFKALREMERETQHQQPKPEKKIEEPKIKELNINQIKIRPPSQDNLIFQLVKLKQIDGGSKRDRPRKISEIHIPLTLIASHNMEHRCIKFATCAICNDSELELDIEEIILEKAERMDINDIIIGQKILKYKHPLIEKSDGKHTFPIFMTTFNDDLPFSVNGGPINADDNIPGQLDRKPPPMSGKYAEKEPPKGVIRYALSDRTFIEKGWTMLPTEKVVRKMNVYRMRPAHPEFDWFEHNKNKKIMHYDSGEKLAEFDDNGRGRLYYRNGRLALDYYNAEEINAQQRFVIHSSGELDARGCSRPLAILATFDFLGNGIVFDHTGKIRLKYNQTEGVVLDRSIGPVSHWKWHTLNDPPVLQQVMIDTQMAHKDPDILKLGGPVEIKTRPDNEEMLAIEFDNFIKEKSKKLSQKFKPFQIKMKALKINEHFSLRILDQATIYLIFRDGSTNLKINLGMILDHQEIVDTDTAEVGEVSNSLERFPARTDSLAGLQNSVAFAQRIERARIERERRLRPTQPCSSSDKLTAAASRPLRAPLRTVASVSTVATCRCRKPTLNNLYYDTRLI